MIAREAEVIIRGHEIDIAREAALDDRLLPVPGVTMRAILSTLAFLAIACNRGSSTPGDTTAIARVPSNKVDFDAARTAVLNRDSLMIRSMRSKNLDSLMTLYAPDAESMQEATPEVKGTEGLRATYAAFFKSNPRDLNFKLKGVGFSDDGTLAYDRGSFTATVDGPAGKPLKVSGDYLTIWKKIDGRWVTVAEISNSAPPAM